LEWIGGSWVDDREYISTSSTISTADIALSGIEEMTDAAKTVITLQHALKREGGCTTASISFRDSTEQSNTRWE
jgi:hypothetical protein